MAHLESKIFDSNNIQTKKTQIEVYPDKTKLFIFLN